MYPMITGPKRTPIIAYVTTIDKAMPGEYFLEVPARKKVIGNMDEVPIPTNEKPIMAGQNVGKTTAKIIPIAINMELNEYMDFIPITLMI